MPLIKRYANRKLYDADSGRYVTLEEVGEMVRNGEDVTVVDHATGADMTTITLLQVMFEQEKRIGGQLPQTLLTWLIQTGGVHLRGLRHALDALSDPMAYVNQELRRRLQRLVENDKISADEMARLEELLLASELTQEAVEPAAGKRADATEIEELARQIERLEEEIASRKEKRPPA